METLSTSLAPSVKRKNKKPTQGKVVPVMKPAKPYKPPVRSKPKTIVPPVGRSANEVGVQAQQKAIETRTPSTQMNISYESDPVLARIRALGGQDVANARSQAEALRKQAIIDSGLTDVGAEIGVDPTTIQAAAANPFSTRATIERTGQERGRELDESLNQQNLFYGGHRATQLSDLARSQAEAMAGLNTDIRGLLGGINSGVMDAERGAALQEQEAIEAAAERERQAALEQAYLDALADPGLAPEPNITDALGGYPEGMAPLPYDPTPVLSPEEELLLALGVGSSGTFNQYAL